jgi:hypothetical protein
LADALAAVSLIEDTVDADGDGVLPSGYGLGMYFSPPTTWRSYAAEFTVLKPSNPGARIQFAMAAAPGTYRFRNVSLVAVPQPEPPAGINLVQNSDFAQGYDYWNWWNKAGTTASLGFAGGEAAVTITNGGTGTSDVQLFFVPSLVIEQGRSYRLSFRARSYADRQIRAKVEERGVDLNGDGNAYTAYTTYTASLTTTMSLFQTTFTMASGTNPDTRLNFHLGGSNNDVWIDDVSLVPLAPEWTSVGATPTPSLAVPPSNTQIGVLASTNVPSTVYLVAVAAGSPAPDADQVIAATDGSGAPATSARHAQLTLYGGMHYSIFVLEGLAPGTSYDCYLVAVDAWGGRSTVVQLGAATSDVSTVTVSGSIGGTWGPSHVVVVTDSPFTGQPQHFAVATPDGRGAYSVELATNSATCQVQVYDDANGSGAPEGGENTTVVASAPFVVDAEPVAVPEITISPVRAVAVSVTVTSSGGWADDGKLHVIDDATGELVALGYFPFTSAGSTAQLDVTIYGPAGSENLLPDGRYRLAVDLSHYTLAGQSAPFSVMADGTIAATVPLVDLSGNAPIGGSLTFPDAPTTSQWSWILAHGAAGVYEGWVQGDGESTSLAYSFHAPPGAYTITAKTTGGTPLYWGRLGSPVVHAATETDAGSLVMSTAR